MLGIGKRVFFYISHRRVSQYIEIKHSACRMWELVWDGFGRRDVICTPQYDSAQSASSQTLGDERENYCQHLSRVLSRRRQSEASSGYGLLANRIDATAAETTNHQPVHGCKNVQQIYRCRRYTVKCTLLRSQNIFLTFFDMLLTSSVTRTCWGPLEILGQTRSVGDHFLPTFTFDSTPLIFRHCGCASYELAVFIAVCV